MTRPGDVRRRLLVAGRVQGVGYRAACARRARELGLAGHVRNCDDGRVEVVAEGDRRALDLLTDWCRLGPPLASVIDLDVSDGPPRGATDFEVAR